MAKSTKGKASKPVKRTKPEKPFDGFPLTANGNGQWSKKLHGKVFYFGGWDDWEAALEEYQRDWPYILKHGEKPQVDMPVAEDEATIGGLCDSFIHAKRLMLESDELVLRTFKEYEDAAACIVAYFTRSRTLASLQPVDFDKFRSRLSVGPKGRRSPVTLARHVRLARIVFKYAYEAGLIERQIRFGPHFKEPSKRTLRVNRQSQDKKMYEADEIRRMLCALTGDEIDVEGKPDPVKLNPNPIMQAMILLAINGGLGNRDIACLPQSAVDLEDGWIDFPRPKTAVERRIPLWPETVEALRVAIENRPKAKHPGDVGLCFLTRTGAPWVRNSSSGKQSWVDSLGQEFTKLLKSLSINGRRGFYCLRHSFETIAGESRDQVAVNHVMGHVDSTMAGVYRERIGDDRLRDVVETVRDWLQPAKALSKQPAV